MSSPTPIGSVLNRVRLPAFAELYGQRIALNAGATTGN